MAIIQRPKICYEKLAKCLDVPNVHLEMSIFMNLMLKSITFLLIQFLLGTYL